MKKKKFEKFLQDLFLLLVTRHLSPVTLLFILLLLIGIDPAYL